MRKSGKTLLDSVTGGSLLHQGGEASIYLLNIGGASYILKWYNDGYSFDEDVVERAYKVRTPGLYHVEEWGKRNGNPYLIYDYVDGFASDKLGRIPVAVALVALRQVASTLSALRKQGVSHGDLNPANVIFTVDPGFQSVVIDVGIVGPGALAYAAPERFQGRRADEKSDLFSLGLLLYRWIAGEDLISAEGYEQFAEQMANVENLNVSEKLYSTLAFDSSEGAVQLKALEALWAGLLRSDPSERVEDFEELDEILEIALDKIAGGEVSLAAQIAQFVESNLTAKTGSNLSGSELLENAVRKVPNTLDNCLPFAISKKNNWLKWAVLGAFGLILALIVLLLSSGTMRFGIDATGDQLLKRSRSMETSTESEKASNLKVDSLLLDLPVPAAE